MPPVPILPKRENSDSTDPISHLYTWLKLTKVNDQEFGRIKQVGQYTVKARVLISGMGLGSAIENEDTDKHSWSRGVPC